MKNALCARAVGAGGRENGGEGGAGWRAGICLLELASEKKSLHICVGKQKQTAARERVGRGERAELAQC